MAINFAQELEDAGSDLSRQDFFELVQETRANLFPSWPDDELLCHPHDANQLCEAVRAQMHVQLPDHIILHALLSSRKPS